MLTWRLTTTRRSIRQARVLRGSRSPARLLWLPIAKTCSSVMLSSSPRAQLRLKPRAQCPPRHPLHRHHHQHQQLRHRLRSLHLELLCHQRPIARGIGRVRCARSRTGSRVPAARFAARRAQRSCACRARRTSIRRCLPTSASASNASATLTSRGYS